MQLLAAAALAVRASGRCCHTETRPPTHAIVAELLPHFVMTPLVPILPHYAAEARAILRIAGVVDDDDQLVDGERLSDRDSVASRLLQQRARSTSASADSTPAYVVDSALSKAFNQSASTYADAETQHRNKHRRHNDDDSASDDDVAQH